MIGKELVGLNGLVTAGGDWQPFSAAAGGSGDPNFANVALLVVNQTGKPDGNTAFLDQSSNAFTVVTVPPAQWDTGVTPPSPMDASLLCASTAALTIADNAILEPGSGDLTIELIINNSGAAQGRAFTKGTYALGMTDIGFITDSGSVYFQLSSNGTTDDIISGFIAGVGILPANTWSYIAARRSGTAITTAYKNAPVAGQATTAGVSATSSAAINNSAIGFTIGNDNNNSFMPGNICCVRYTLGVARDITVVPTFPFPTS